MSQTFSLNSSRQSQSVGECSFTTVEQGEIDQFFGKYGMDAKAVSENTWILPLAAIEGKSEVVRFLVSNGVNVNTTGNNDWTLLHFAVGFNQDVEVAKSLIYHGANVNAKDDSGYTPLHVAATFGRFELVLFLVAHGADIHAKNNIGYTPLHAAMFYNENVKVAEFLISRGANIDAQAMHGITPLDIAREKDNMTMIEYLSGVSNR